MKIVIDTGPWVALIDRSEGRHAECVGWFKGFKGEIFSSEAVLTEVLFLLDFSRAAQTAALDFVIGGAIQLIPSTPESLRAVSKFMKKYEDLPMDFADATLLCLARDLELQHIATFDQKHFSIYRLPGRPPFITLP
jgi:predicted nucleic acid-binding protein